ncbi:MAG: HAD family phosphatase [Cyclobacteriaceae bacterium]
MIGLIFDMDGVIVDNHYYHFKAWQLFFEKYGKSISEDDYKKNINGRTMKAIIHGIFEDKKLTDTEAKAYGNEKEAIYRDIYADHLAPTDGLISFLEMVKSADVKTVIGTSAPKENVTFTIDGLKLNHYFDDILDERAVTKGKPDPEIYLKCAQAINYPNSQCVVFEDALAGIEAGKSAGSAVVGVATTHEKHELTENTNLIIPDFENLTLDQLKNIL